MAKEVQVAFVGDIALNEDRTPHGSKVSPGGAAYYSMVGASFFTPEVGIVAKIGQDFDTELLERRNIDTAGVRQTEGDTCRFILTQYTDNTRDFSAERGVAEEVDTSIFPEQYWKAPYIHLPTQLPEHALHWLSFLEGHGNVSADPFEAFVREYPDLTRLMLEKADFIFINEEEYALLRATTSSLADKPVVLKKGPKGAMYMSPEETYTFPAPKVKALETTGAGDVLAGAFLAQLANGLSIPLALENAIAIASISVTQFGVEHIPAK